MFHLLVLILGCLFGISQATQRYYGTYLSFGTGDTIVNVLQAHGGPNLWRLKWNIECLDGEAMWGIQDLVSDFQRLWNVWCKFMFPYKPPSNGLYPFYPTCTTRNLTTEHFCYDPRDNLNSLNSFVTGIWDDEYQFRVDRPAQDASGLYKCCKTPPGYYIDYTSCMYKPTHDQFFEYYDATVFIVLCDSGYVMTGIAKKILLPIKEYYLEWIQCCRLGFASGPVIPPPALSPILPASAALLGRSLDDMNGLTDHATGRRVIYPASYVTTQPTTNRSSGGPQDFTQLYAPRYSTPKPGSPFAVKLQEPNTNKDHPEKETDRPMANRPMPVLGI